MKHTMKELFSFGFGFLLLITSCATTGGYTQNISEAKAVPSLSVTVTYLGGVFWEAKVKNNSAETVKLIWDESAYVNSVGKSTRLIRGQTRKLHSAQIQPASPIPPGALLTESFTAEALASYASSYVQPPLENPDGIARIYLSFEASGETYTWEGAISFDLHN